MRKCPDISIKEIEKINIKIPKAIEEIIEAINKQFNELFENKNLIFKKFNKLFEKDFKTIDGKKIIFSIANF